MPLERFASSGIFLLKCNNLFISTKIRIIISEFFTNHKKTVDFIAFCCYNIICKSNNIKVQLVLGVSRAPCIAVIFMNCLKYTFERGTK